MRKPDPNQGRFDFDRPPLACPPVDDIDDPGWHMAVARERQEREIAEALVAEQPDAACIARAAILRNASKARVRACAPGGSLYAWLVKKIARRIAPGELQRRLAEDDVQA